MNFIFEEKFCRVELSSFWSFGKNWIDGFMVFFDFVDFWFLISFWTLIFDVKNKTALNCAVTAYFYIDLTTTHERHLNRFYPPYFGSTRTFVMFCINRNHKIINKNSIWDFEGEKFLKLKIVLFYTARRKILRCQRPFSGWIRSILFEDFGCWWR